MIKKIRRCTVLSKDLKRVKFYLNSFCSFDMMHGQDTLHYR